MKTLLSLLLLIAFTHVHAEGENSEPLVDELSICLYWKNSKYNRVQRTLPDDDNDPTAELSGPNDNNIVVGVTLTANDSCFYFTHIDRSDTRGVTIDLPPPQHLPPRRNVINVDYDQLMVDIAMKRIGGQWRYPEVVNVRFFSPSWRMIDNQLFDGSLFIIPLPEIDKPVRAVFYMLRFTGT